MEQRAYSPIYRRGRVVPVSVVDVYAEQLQEHAGAARVTRPLLVLLAIATLASLAVCIYARSRFAIIPPRAVEKQARAYVAAQWQAAAADPQAWGYLDLTSTGTVRGSVEAQQPQDISPADVVAKPPQDVQVDVPVTTSRQAVAFTRYTLILRNGQTRSVSEALNFERLADGSLAVVRWTPVTDQPSEPTAARPLLP